MPIEIRPTANPSSTRRLILQAPAALGLAMYGLHGESHAALDPVVGSRGKGTPQRGGVLVRSLSGDPPNFDTFSNTTGRVITVVGPCCNGLIRFDEFDANKIVPDLAESWQVSDDEKTYTFRLRSGVKFHDGKPMTSADVKYTFDTMRSPPAGMVSVRAQLLDAVTSIDASNPTIVRFNLDRKSPGLLANLAGGWMVVLPKHILEKGPMKDTIVGTGPFKLKEYKRGTSIELVRNPEYHIPGKPYLDGQKMFIIPDANTEFAYFRTGQLDAIDSSSPAMALQWEKELAGKGPYMVAGPSQSALSVHFNSLQKPWDDVRVRKAACLAINREEALTTLMKGEGVVGGWACPGPWAMTPAELAKIPGYAKYSNANIAEAKKLLAEAGFPNGFKETILVRRIDLYTPLAIFVKDQLTKIGIEITIDPQETATYNQARTKRQFKLDAGGRTYLTNDPDAIYGDSVTCKGATNYGGVCDPKTDELYTRLSQETDPKKRLALSKEIEARALQAYASYMILWRSQYRLYQKNVHGWAKHPQEDNSMRLEDCWKSKA
ncbi:MAG: ABC transporter substrate-binding protein [Pseudomonadota bacterium]